jgi:nicotinamidase-related amidase
MKKALIVVDFQNDFVNGSLGFEGAEKLDNKICDRITEYREQNADVIFTFDTHDNDFLNTYEGKSLPVPHCIRGSDGWNLYGKTAGMLNSSSLGFEKSSFGSLDFAGYLKSKKYESIMLVGLVSNICVISNAVLAKAALPEAEIIVDSSCTDSNDKELNQKALDVMAGMQIKII